MMEKSRSAGFRRKALARWRWLKARGVELEAIAAELGVRQAELRSWIDEADGRELIVPVQITEADDRPRSIVVRIGGMRIEGLSIADVVELARRLS